MPRIQSREYEKRTQRLTISAAWRSNQTVISPPKVGARSSAMTSLSVVRVVAGRGFALDGGRGPLRESPCAPARERGDRAWRTVREELGVKALVHHQVVGVDAHLAPGDRQRLEGEEALVPAQQLPDDAHGLLAQHVFEVLLRDGARLHQDRPEAFLLP